MPAAPTLLALALAAPFAAALPTVCTPETIAGSTCVWADGYEYGGNSCADPWFYSSENAVGAATDGTPVGPVRVEARTACSYYPFNHSPYRREVTAEVTMSVAEAGVEWWAVESNIERRCVIAVHASAPSHGGAYVPVTCTYRLAPPVELLPVLP